MSDLKLALPEGAIATQYDVNGNVVKRYEYKNKGGDIYEWEEIVK